MNQATQATTPAASSEARHQPGAMPGTFAHAAGVAARVVSGLQQPPTSVEISEDFPSGYRVHLKYRGARVAGLYEFAASLDIPVTKACTEFGVHLDALTRFETVELHCSALADEDQVDAIEEARRPAPEPQDPAAQPVPLGSSVLAAVPVITPTAEPADGGDDVARCVRCGCTEDAACEGGCYWVPNRQLVDLCSACATGEELQAMTYTAEVADGAQ